MDSLSNPIMVSYRLTTEDVSAFTANWQILLDVTGHFSIYVNGDHWYEESEFCLIEFAREIFGWLQATQDQLVPLEYESMESEERPLLWIRPADSQWILGAVHARHPLTATFSLPQIRRPFAGFVESLQRDIADRFGDEFAFRVRGVITGLSPLE